MAQFCLENPLNLVSFICAKTKSQRSQTLRTLRILLLLFQGSVISADSLSRNKERERQQKSRPLEKGPVKYAAFSNFEGADFYFWREKRDQIERII